MQDATYVSPVKTVMAKPFGYPSRFILSASCMKEPQKTCWQGFAILIPNNIRTSLTPKQDQIKQILICTLVVVKFLT